MLEFVVDTKNGKNTVLECPELFTNYEKNQDLHSFLAKIYLYEQSFNCSGYCSKNPYYVFADVNKGPP